MLPLPNNPPFYSCRFGKEALTLKYKALLKKNIMITRTNNANNTRLIVILSVVTCLLLVPLIAMQFTNEVDWGPFDFMIMGILLYGTGLSCELVLRKVKETTHRIIICGVILFALFLTWAELAVGVFGTPFAGS